MCAESRNGVRALILATAMVSLPTPAWATDGMNPIAYDARAAGMGGADTALSTSALAMTNNPAGMAFTKKPRIDFNLTALIPMLTMEDEIIMGGLVPINPGLSSEPAVFPLFGIAYSHPIRRFPGLVVAIGMFVQGGMGADFRDAKTFVDDDPNTQIGARVPAEGRYDIHSQVMYVKLAPTVAYRYRWLALGVSLHVGLAQMEFYHHGMQFPEPDGDGMAVAHKMAFASGFTLGVGGRVGAQASFLDDRLRFGLAYMMQVKPKFSGTMDIETLPGSPEWAAFTDDFGWAQEVGLGVAGRLFKKRLTLAFDFRWVNWSSAVDVVTMEAENAAHAPPGMSEFPFYMRWVDSIVLAVGADYEIHPGFLSARVGYNYGKAPSTAVGINPLFPPVTEHHITAGVGLERIWRNLSLNLALEIALPNKVTSNDSNQMAYEPTNPGYPKCLPNCKPNNYTVAVEMMQVSIHLGVSYAFE